MYCERAADLVERHLNFLATLEGQKVADKQEILAAFGHVKSCLEPKCSGLWHIVFRASRELALENHKPESSDYSFGWDGEY